MKQFLIALIIVVVLGGAYYILRGNAAPAPSGTDTGAPAEQTGQTGAEASGSGTESTPAGANSYTMAEVATHNDASSCWSAIDGNVYDLTSWIPQHPGGAQNILIICGKDGTVAFHNQHDDRKKQADLLATMKIGVLAQ